MQNNIPEFTVTEFSRAIKMTLEDRFGYVRIKGEVTGFKKASSGHYYFNLREGGALLSAVCFKNSVNNINTWTGLGITIFSTSGNAITNNGTIWVSLGSGTNTIAYANANLPSSWVGLGVTIFSTSGNGISWSGSTFFATGQGSSNTVAYSSNGTQWTGLGTTIFNSIGNSVAVGSNKIISTGSPSGSSKIPLFACRGFNTGYNYNTDYILHFNI